MAQNTAEPPEAPRPPSSGRPPLLFYKPYVLRLIDFLEQAEPFVMAHRALSESPPRTSDDPAAAGNQV